MYRIGWFSTGRDAAARELLKTVWDAIQSGELKVEIAYVFSNREPGEFKQSDLFFEQVRSYRIPLRCLSFRRFRDQAGLTRPLAHDAAEGWRLAYDREVMACLEGFQVHLCVLAGYMLIVGEEMCRRYTMINLHPAAPGGPAGTWQEVVWQLIEARARETGVMIHLAIPDLDHGPPVTYCTFPLRGSAFDPLWQEIEGLSVEEIKARQGENNALFKEIRRQGLRREFPLIVATIKALSEGLVKVAEGRILSATGEPISGYCLTEQIERSLA